MNKIILILIFSFYFMACNSIKKEVNVTLKVIDLQGSFDHFAKLSFSHIARNIEYIPLELNEKCIIGEFSRFFLNDKYIIAISFRQIFLFDRNSGRFVRELGKYDKGPEGYRSTLFVMPYNEYDKTIYTQGWQINSYNIYNLSGELLNRISPSTYISSIGFLNNDIYAGYIPNFKGDEKYKIALFNKQDSCIQSYKNHSRFLPTKNVVVWRSHGWFYRFKEELSFFELFNDTIYRVTRDKLIPKYVFNMGKYSPPYMQQGISEFMFKQSKNYFFVNDIYETENNLFFKIHYDLKNYICLYDKKENKTIVNEPDKSLISGFHNDIDNFIPFQYSSLNKGSELVGFAEAYQVLDWFEKNPELAAKLPAYMQNFRKLKPTDNPIVMIAKLKE